MSENDYIKIEGERFIIDMMYARADNVLGQAIYPKFYRTPKKGTA